jgi:dolichyl-phosphate-mannose-protein mannosyltransferase
MASRGAVASGADHDQSTRRRNVPSTPSTSGQGKSAEIDDKKTQAKKVCSCDFIIPDRKLCVRSIEGSGLTFNQPQPTFLQILDEYEFIIAPLIFTFLAFFTRLYKIGLSPIVTWDEAQ